jgi:hypothetical protein
MLTTIQKIGRSSSCSRSSASRATIPWSASRACVLAAACRLTPRPQARSYSPTAVVRRCGRSCRDRAGSAHPKTVGTMDELLKALVDVRNAGYACDRGEIVPDIACVGAPIIDRFGAVVAGGGRTGR